MYIMPTKRVIRAEVKHNHRPSWIQRLHELQKIRADENMRKMSSYDDLDLRSNRSDVPRIKLPPLTDKDSSKSEGYNSARNLSLRRERNMFAKGHADKGVLFKSSLSTSLGDIPQEVTHKKYEKLSYKKRIYEGEQAPAPSVTTHYVAPISPAGASYPRLPAIKTTVRNKVRRRQTDADVFKIYNSTRHTVEYYEHDGQVYVCDGHIPWKKDCACKDCREKKKNWLDEHKKGEDRKEKKMKSSYIPPQPETSPAADIGDGRNSNDIIL